MFTCGLMDIGFNGHPFTWTNKRFGKAFICERLDRALANLEWNNQFPDAKLYHLTSYASDHSPILLDMKPFRYEIAWSTDNSFKQIMEKVWSLSSSSSNNLNFYSKYLSFKSKACWWKK